MRLNHRVLGFVSVAGLAVWLTGCGAFEGDSGDFDPNRPAAGETALRYRRFAPGLGNERILASAVMRNAPEMQRDIDVGRWSVSIADVDVGKNPTRGFQAYFEVVHDGLSQRLGFWHPRDPRMPFYLKENGCQMNVQGYCDTLCEDAAICGGLDCVTPEIYGDSLYVCGGIFALPTEEWIEEPTAQEAGEGVVSVFHQNRIFLEELDYDFATDTWNYAKISVGHYRETRRAADLEDR